ncbi:hypothetical protein ACWDWO_27020 [Actinopolymorpha singaporensis]|uniref:Transmembrane protein n=1 Tax=Actinopolymorpha singaporensis TaxID=117157 RepID=A0A1H1TUQ6_9ACTN|nr:hypothetical protein [Actinopolymorpha singaporensis]SDS63932.1 hypothetical protein SAMN04489717_3347 [Actinopolymorpha singaporensis]
MHILTLALDGAWKVLLAGLVLGAGLPVVFAFGIRALAHGHNAEGRPHDAGVLPVPRSLGRPVAVVCFAIVLAAVGLGITYIVASGLGQQLSFEHIYPTLVPKK